MGETVKEDGTIGYQGTVSKIMSRGEFNIKIMIKSGENHTQVLENYGGSILSIPWETETDKIKMKFKVNLSPKIQQVRNGPPVGIEEADDIMKLALTRRMVLSKV